MTKYKLLKDLPAIKCGAISKFIDSEICFSDEASGARYGYAKDFVENNPEWFKEVKPHIERRFRNRMVFWLTVTNSIDEYCYRSLASNKTLNSSTWTIDELLPSIWVELHPSAYIYKNRNYFNNGKNKYYTKKGFIKIELSKDEYVNSVPIWARETNDVEAMDVEAMIKATKEKRNLIEDIGELLLFGLLGIGFVLAGEKQAKESK